MVLPSAIPPPSDHLERGVEGQLDHLYLLSLTSDAAARARAVARPVSRRVEVHALGDRAGAHVGVEDVVDPIDEDSELLFGLATDRRLRVLAVEQAGGDLDEHAVGVAVDVGREPELTGQQHVAAVGVVEQDRGAVAAVVGLALLRRPAPIPPAIVEGRAPQHVPAVGGHLHVSDHDVGVAPQVPSLAIEPGAASPVRHVHTDAGAIAHARSSVVLGPPCRREPAGRG